MLALARVASTPGVEAADPCSSVAQRGFSHGCWGVCECVWCEQGLQIRPVRSNRRPPVAIYRTGLTRNRLNSNPNSKLHVQPVPTGLPAGMTGLPAGMTGLGIFYFFEFKFEFWIGGGRPVWPVWEFFFNSNLNFELGPFWYLPKP